MNSTNNNLKCSTQLAEQTRLAVAFDGDEPIIFPEPVMFGELETPAIPAEMLPEPLASYVQAVANHTQTPTAMAAMLALSVIATAVQKRFEVLIKPDYTESLSLWTLVALPPGSRKSAVMKVITAPLKEWEYQKASELQAELAEQENLQHVLNHQIEQKRRDAAKASDEHSRIVLMDELNKLQRQLEDSNKIRAPRLWTSDTTPEQLQNLLAAHGERMAVLADEGGIFEVMAGLYNDGRANTDIFLVAHDGGSGGRIDRGSRTVMLHRPALTFGLTIQPEVVSQLANGEKRRFRSNGTLARFLWCLPKSNVGGRDVRAEHPIREETKLRYYARVHELLNIPPDIDPYGIELPRQLKLSKEARELWFDFAQDIENKQGEGGPYEALSDWTGKLAGQTARLAGLFYLSKKGRDATADTQIDADSMKRAIRFAELLIPHAQAAFDLMCSDPAVDDAKYILKFIRERRQAIVKNADIIRLGRFNRGGKQRMQRAIDLLIDRSIVAAARLDTKKPTHIYHVNPRLLTSSTSSTS